MADAGLPPQLIAALDRELEGASRKDLTESAARTSAAYREGRSSAGVIRDASDALAYAVSRAPATYAAALAAITEASARLTGFAPRSLLDVGAGAGAASWAATEVFPDLDGAVWLDANPALLDLAGRLAVQSPALGKAERRLGDINRAALPSADLVLASYVLAEIAPAAQPALVAALWAACEGLLVLVEPGTPAGWTRILQARAIVIEAGGQIVAPCPHAQACPLVAPDWCHFAQRLPRSRDHRLTKAADAPFEDEKFIYLAAARPGLGLAPPQSRILAPPRQDKTGIALKLCEPYGPCRLALIPSRDKPALRQVRRLGWGDTTPSAVIPVSPSGEDRDLIDAGE